jgi:Mn2+/Fe2+ NRAMP family transporter
MALADTRAALGFASFIHVVMRLTTAAIFVPRARVLSSRTVVAHVIGQGLGPAAALGFGLALMTSGLGASMAATVARDLILEGLTGAGMKRVLRWVATFIRTAMPNLRAPGPRLLTCRRLGGDGHRPAIGRHPSV